jgi:uncharacterized protein (TIGR02391 family)
MNEQTQQFLKHFPQEKELLEMEPDELAPFVLRFLKEEGNHAGMLNRHNFGIAVPNGPVGLRLMEAWMWLEREGFLAPKPGDPGQWVFITRKGERVVEIEDFEAYKKASLFPSYIDPVLVRMVKPLFMRGDYDTSVFRAFKEVEVRVRKAAGYGNDEYGRDLMVHAFGTKGPLTDKGAPKGEQDAIRELFAGAISQCKNPSSHREVQFEDAAEAIDMICFANQLLRMVDRISKRVGAL